MTDREALLICFGAIKGNDSISDLIKDIVETQLFEEQGDPVEKAMALEKKIEKKSKC